MKITISPWTHETLWGFAKKKIQVSVHRHCERCNGWIRIKALKVEKVK
jgi:hypothetical protein